MLIGELTLFFRNLTALHIAADKAHYDVMDVLLKHEAKVGISIHKHFHISVGVVKTL